MGEEDTAATVVRGTRTDESFIRPVATINSGSSSFFLDYREFLIAPIYINRILKKKLWLLNM